MQYEEIISIENIFQAWGEFRKGKRGKKDIQVFERRLEDNLIGLHLSLINRTYKHDSSQDFYVNDPKRRMFKKLREKMNSPNFDESLQSYLGYLSHSSSYRLAWRVKMLELL